MKKKLALILSAAIGVVMCTSVACASPFTGTQVAHNFKNDYSISIWPESSDVHDIHFVGSAQTTDWHEAKEDDWQFWLDGPYFAGVKNAKKILKHLEFAITAVNGTPITKCVITAGKGETGAHEFTVSKNDDGTYKCTKQF